jgi:hypothetical protein
MKIKKNCSKNLNYPKLLQTSELLRCTEVKPLYLQALEIAKQVLGAEKIPVLPAKAFTRDSIYGNHK